MSNVKSWLRTLVELFEVLFNSAQRNNRGRTWHQHVVPYQEGWAVRREGNQRITSKHRKQSTAINKAKCLARKYKADVIIHRKSGGIRDRISYPD
ncbi:DUF2188 domain-containing protein [Aggregatimonas sangjinii]|uniref:DUF2188 domain-containing protein n=1 Tax=Aggregatimonas sangjinii TaxID=2583587 RepID=A0A5B7SQZ4_9FLAO|nr:DUF2188 domain-containing protein [Aggregatimonas sangjinii]QCX00987.1 DUF2188 domain-containing protein [Aggregatimonas sangjinii]